MYTVCSRNKKEAESTRQKVDNENCLQTTKQKADNRKVNFELPRKKFLKFNYARVHLGPRHTAKFRAVSTKALHGKVIAPHDASLTKFVLTARNLAVWRGP